MDSDDDFGGYDPTTPAPPPRKQTAPRGGGARKPAAARPGSSKPAATQPAKASSSNAGNTSIDNAIILYSDDEDATEAPPPLPKNKGKSTAAKPSAATTATKPPATTTATKPPAVATNGKAADKGKGKAKDTSLQQDAGDAMEVDEAPAAETSNPPARPKQPPRPAAKPVNKAQERQTASESARIEALERTNARLKKSVEDITAHRDKLAQQVQEALQIRETKPEQLMQEMITQYEATVRAQEQLLEEQSAKLAQLGEVPSSNPAVQFLSREQVEQEKKDLVAKMRKVEEASKAKDAEITTLKQKTQELEQQLEFEIKMATEYREKNPPVPKVNGGPRTAAATVADPLQGQVIKFYEDLTNVLVTKITPGPAPYPAWPDLKEYTFNCTFTYVNNEENNGGPNPSLQFGIRCMWARRDGEDTPPSSRDQLEAKCQFWPMNLEMETPEFREKLDFFADSFVFSREQMGIFIKTLTEKLVATTTESEDDVEEIVNPTPSRGKSIGFR